MESLKKFKYLFLLIFGLMLFTFGSLVGNIIVLIISNVKYGCDYSTTQIILSYFSDIYNTVLSEEGIPYCDLAIQYFEANPIHLEYAKNLGALMQLLSYGPLIIFIIIFLWKDLFEDVKKMKTDIKANLLTCLIGYGSMLGLSLILSLVYAVFDVNGTSANESILQLMMQGEGKWYLLVAVVIFAPICEEIVFRKLLIDTCEKTFNLKPALAIMISSFLFAFIHVTDCASFVFIFQYLALAIPLCLVYHFSNNNIYVSILVHMANNLIVGIGYLMEYGI